MLREVRLRGPLHLIAGRSLNEELRKLRENHAGLPTGLDQVVRDFRSLPGGVSATVTEWRGKSSLVLYTYDYVVKLGATEQQDAYWVNRVQPRGLREHAELARGCLLVRTKWRVAARGAEVPAGSSAHWRELLDEWARLETELADRDEVPRLRPQHDQFLNLLSTVNDAAREVAAKQSTSDQKFAYRQVSPVGGRRHASESRYEFHVVRGAPQRGAHVQVSGEAELCGRVVQVGERAVTVRFDQSVDWNRIPKQGELVGIDLAVVHTMRRNAVNALRARRSQHRSLLEVLVDGEVRPIPQSAADPAEELDPEQLTAFRGALVVPDLLVVLGPPGTGKTRVITEMAQSLALTGERGKTLVSSYANRAVDNVLTRMAQGAQPVTMIRIGDPDKVDPEVRPYLLGEYATSLREEIVQGTRAGLEKYQQLSRARPWHGQLTARLEEWRQDLAAEQLRRDELGKCRRVAGGPAQDRVDELSARVQLLDERVRRRQARLKRLADRADRARRAQIPLLQPVFVLVASLCEQRIIAQQTKVESVARALTEASKSLSAARDELNAVVREVPEVVAAQRDLDDAVEAAAATKERALAAMSMLRNAIAELEPVPEVADSGHDETTLKWLSDLHAVLDTRIELLEERHALLTEWHEEVSNGPVEQLYPELIRYADVIGATCIGSASRPEIAAEEFDLVIVDEAGQIQTSDVLIPLVRGTRAVLVGDHMQLPPVSESEVERKVAGRSGAQEMLDLLRKSALELLVDRLPEDHIVQLRKQRRMPEIIADLVSDLFYGGTLQTMVQREPGDAVFRSPLAFVDTSGLPQHVRSEEYVGQGYRNRVEADLLSRLAAHYQHRGVEWALIVPYQHQLSKIKELAGEWAPDQDTLDANMGTVDSFQGGERDVVLYGFTRSNSRGEVGFLKELRRLNVAFTRAKRQLVLVGDLETLLNSTDEGFRTLIHALHTSLKAGGDLRVCIDVIDRLNEMGS
ncbi:AAA domain-containing protein [Saccharopolyspora shandongensis]|uniref:DEAD/DEAH box helicase n=1 Tax=Saccharopolyspora shandongensis TaxID=418495 RepID=UPI003415D9A9